MHLRERHINIYPINNGATKKKGLTAPRCRFLCRFDDFALSRIVDYQSVSCYTAIGIYDNSYISLNSIQTIYDVQPWLFGILHSRMHVIWVDAAGGKLENSYRYSAKLCYNTFPFPNISAKQKETLNLYVFAVLDERAKHPEKTMAQLYDPEKMPIGLKNAHRELDKAVEQCYRLQPFANDTERLEYLFRLYEEMTQRDTLFAKQKKTRVKK